MSKIKFCSVALILIGFATGCAHIHEVGGVQEKAEIPEGTRVGIGGAEVKEGEKVAVMKSFCKKVNRNRGGSISQCSFQKVGEALVIKVLDHDSAIVRPDEGIQMDSSMRVEKQ